MSRTQVKTCPKCQRSVPIAEFNRKVCRKCNCKTVLLSQLFTKWPVQCFLELSADQQVNFWQDNDTKGKNNLFAKIAKDISTVREKVEREKTAGRYLPIEVYATMGYTLEKIEKNCPFEWDAQLECNTYLLNTKEIIIEKIHKEVTQELLSLRDSGLRGRMSHYCSPLKKAGKKRKSKSSRRSSSGSSSSSASSSSGADPKKAKARAKQAAASTKKFEAARKKECALHAKKEKLMKAALAKKDAAAIKSTAAAVKKQAKGAAAQTKKDSNNKYHKLCAVTTAHIRVAHVPRHAHLEKYNARCYSCSVIFLCESALSELFMLHRVYACRHACMCVFVTCQAAPSNVKLLVYICPCIKDHSNTSLIYKWVALLGSRDIYVSWLISTT
jgi:hypothetical protein